MVPSTEHYLSSSSQLWRTCFSLMSRGKTDRLAEAKRSNNLINNEKQKPWFFYCLRLSFFIFCFTDFFRNKLGSEDETKIKFIRTIFQLN